MKKLIGTVVLAALVAGAAFADIGFGGFGRGVWAPIAYDGDAKMMNIAGWGWGGPRVGVGISGNSDNVGFAADLKWDEGKIDVNDNANIWVKPWDFLKITLGQFFDETLRGSCEFGTYGWLRCQDTCLGADLTFSRIAAKNTTAVFDRDSSNPMVGALVSLTPIDGLYVALGLPVDYCTALVEDVFKSGQYQVGYTIADTATIKAQYRGQGDWGVINAAVDLLMIENQKISLGAHIPTKSDKMAISIAATYNGQFDALGIAAYVTADIDGYAGTYMKDLFGLGIGVGVSYDLGDGIGVEGDVRASLGFPKDGDSAGVISVGAYVNKGFSNGGVGIGVLAAFSVNDHPITIGGGTGLAATEDAHIVVPVRMQYFF